MPAVSVVALGKKKAGKVELDPAIFEVPVKPHLFHAEVRRQQAARQRGTHATRNRAAVSGGGAKPWRQKGTGRARQGTTRAPQWAGGGVVFGPVPRDHGHRVPKKVRRAALCGALALRLREDALMVVEALELEEPRTRRVVEALSQLGLGAAEPVLIVTGEVEPHLERAARNLPWALVLRAEGLNVYDVLRHPRLLLTRAGLEAVQRRLGTPSQETSS